MPKSDQGVTQDRYMVIPRTLIFVFRPGQVLLLKGAPTKRLWANRYNGIGGHIEQGETVLAAAQRELMEETGLKLHSQRLCGTVMVDASDGTGICLFVMRGDYQEGVIQASEEGTLEWIDLDKIGDYALVEDLKILLPRVVSQTKETAPFSARSYYNGKDQLTVSFEEMIS